MSVADWPKWADMNWLRLLEGPGHDVILPVAPTMRNITYQGERYSRMPDSRTSVAEGETADGRTSYGGAYLWRGWLPARLAAMTAAEGSAP